MKRTLCIAWLGLALAACGGDDDDGGSIDGGVDGGSATAAVTIGPVVSGQSVTGAGTFTPVTGGVAFAVSIAGAAQGLHGIHIHEMGDCGMEGMNAGGHWDPDAGMHGMPGADPSHLGDLGNITIAADGTGTLQYTNPGWTIGDGATTDVVGHAVILHELTDDFGQPLGNAGARFGCGVIAVQ